MLICRAGAAPPAAGGNATSVSAAIRFQFVTSLGCVAAGAACTATAVMGAGPASATIETSAPSEINRLRVIVSLSLPRAAHGIVVRIEDRFACMPREGLFDIRRIFPRAIVRRDGPSPRRRDRRSRWRSPTADVRRVGPPGPRTRAHGARRPFGRAILGGTEDEVGGLPARAGSRSGAQRLDPGRDGRGRWR